jgi:hypothetical protein
VLFTGSHIGIDGAALVDWHTEISRCGSATNDYAGVLSQLAKQAGVDVELEMPGPRPESSTKPIEIRRMTEGARHLPVIEELPCRSLRQGPARLAPHVALNGPNRGGRDGPLVPETLSWELSVEDHGLSPTSGNAETRRCFRE